MAIALKKTIHTTTEYGVYVGNNTGDLTDSLGKEGDRAFVLGSWYIKIDNAWIQIDGSGGGSAVWGGIAGSLPDQVDLQSALDDKMDLVDQNLDTTSDVEFASLIAGGLTYPVVDGSDGYVLTTDGAGNLAFEAGGGGGGGIGGSTGSTDSVILVSDGTGGATLRAASTAATINSSGDITGRQLFASNALYVGSSGNAVIGVNASDRTSLLASDALLGWTDSTDAFGTPDVGLKRQQSGTLKLTDGSSGAGVLWLSRGAFFGSSNSGIVLGDDSGGVYAALTSGSSDPMLRIVTSSGGVPTTTLTGLRAKFAGIGADTIANLPASPVAGTIASVNNATTPIMGMAVVGGGSAQALVYYNGSQWTVIGV